MTSFNTALDIRDYSRSLKQILVRFLEEVQLFCFRHSTKELQARLSLDARCVSSPKASLRPENSIKSHHNLFVSSLSCHSAHVHFVPFEFIISHSLFKNYLTVESSSISSTLHTIAFSPKHILSFRRHISDSLSKKQYFEMPVKWTPETDQIVNHSFPLILPQVFFNDSETKFLHQLLLKILETSEISVDAKAISASWRKYLFSPEPPTYTPLLSLEDFATFNMRPLEPSFPKYIIFQKKTYTNPPPISQVSRSSHCTRRLRAPRENPHDGQRKRIPCQIQCLRHQGQLHSYDSP